MEKRVLFVLPFLLTVFLFFGKAQTFAAGRLYLEPADRTVTVGESFDVYIWVDPGGAEIGAVDAILNFDFTKLEVVSVGEEIYFKNDSLGTFQGFISKTDQENGKISVYSYANQPNSYVSEAGKIARIQFKAKAEGAASVTFICEAGGSGDSSIWDKEATDIIDCNTVGSGSYTIAAGGSESPTNTPTPTPTPTTVDSGGSSTSTPTPTPTTSELPQAGISTPLVLIAIFGLLTSMIGLLIAVI